MYAVPKLTIKSSPGRPKRYDASKTYSFRYELTYPLVFLSR